MVIPAPMNVYAGAEMLQQMDPRWRAIQQKEFLAIGVGRARECGATGLTEDLIVGYELGLATARAIIAGSAEVLSKGADPEKVL